MKNKILISILLLISGFAKGQQQLHLSQFMMNKTLFNVASVGSENNAIFTITNRNQWFGIEGSPNTQIINYHQPFFNSKVGFGSSLYRHTIGITTNWKFDIGYAYRIKFSLSTLSLGVGVSTKYYGRDYSDSRIVSTLPSYLDESIPTGFQNVYIPNASVGIYFNTKRFYLGVSTPRLIEREIHLSGDKTSKSYEKRHYYLMSGFKMSTSNSFSFTPQFMIRYLEDVPLDLQINTNFLFYEKVLVGASYHSSTYYDNRTKGYASVLTGMNFTNNWSLFLSYDYDLSDISKVSAGSLEVQLKYNTNKKKPEEVDLINPNYY